MKDESRFLGFFLPQLSTSALQPSAFILLAVLLLLLLSGMRPAFGNEDADRTSFLLKGKNCLDKGDYDGAITSLTSSYEKLPVLGDYALLWRAKAFEEKGRPDKALEDLRAIRQKYKESRLVKKARLKEVDLLKKTDDPSVAGLYEGLMRDTSPNLDIKYAYALYLKDHKEPLKAKELFKEVYLSSANHLAADALKELSPSDISAEDLCKRGRSLNAAWHFEEAEKCYREALRMSKDNPGEEVFDGLAYSLFRQKRYKEAAGLYRQIKNHYWRARSIFRAGDMDILQAELPELSKTGDKRISSVLLAYGMKKRRDGDGEEALRVFNDVLSRYPSAKEDALWAAGWTYYLARDYRNASKYFSQLSAIYGDSKYHYWNAKCKRLLGEPETVKLSLSRKNGHDFYAFISLVKNNQPAPAVERRSPNISLGPLHAERIGILERLGLTQEAGAELLHLARRNPSPGDLISISSYLKRMGNYKTAMNVITRTPYSEEIHDLYYPLGYWTEVQEASKKRDLDPYLILSVMREESRFAPDARSIAGALGLMQMMPQTAHRFNKRIKGKHASELYDAKTNIMIGSQYLKQLLDKFGSIPPALAAYNGGEDAVNEWMRKGSYLTIDEFIEDIPYDETRNYVKKVMTTYFEYLRACDDPDIAAAARTRIGNL